MIIPFLSTEQFFQHLQYAIVMQVIIMICMVNFAKRQPTDYDTKYMRRWRVVSGIAWFVLAFFQFFIIEKFSLPIYYYEIYGTMTPSSDIIQTGVSPYLTLYPNVEWGHLTFQQWLLETRIENVLRYISLGLYFILYKPSSVKKWVKVRKFIGYTLLLYFLPATINFHYFSVAEFASIIIVSLFIYFLTRTYKKDAVAPIAPESHIGYNGKPIEDMQPIEPEEVVLPTEDNLQACNMQKEVSQSTLRQRLLDIKNNIDTFFKTLYSKFILKRKQRDTKNERDAKSSSRFILLFKSNLKKITICLIVILITIAAIVGAYRLYDYYYHEYLPKKRYQAAIEKVISEINSSEEGKRVYYWLILSKNPSWEIPEFYDGYCPLELQEYRKEAFKWYETKAYEGDAEYQISLATLYDFGEEEFYVEKNKRRAAYWYEQSANQGFVPAYSFIGICYRDGEGVSKDLRKALEWFQKGSEANDQYCQYFLADMYHKGVYIEDGFHYEYNKIYGSLPVPYGSEIVARRWDDNKLDYYTLYKYEVKNYKCILPPDIEKAKELWRKAAAQGHEGAKEKLEQIY